MRTQHLLTGVAVTVVLLAGAPAGAVSLNIGGEDGLLSIDDDSAEPAEGGIGVTIGGSEGGVSVDTNLDGAPADITGGGNDGAGDGDADSGGGDSGSDGSLLDGQDLVSTGEGDDLVDVDTSDDDGAVVDLFGTSGSDSRTIEVDVLEDAGDEAVVRLFGGSHTMVAVEPLGANEDAVVSLFGPAADSGGEAAGGGVDTTPTGSIGDDDDGAPGAPDNSGSDEPSAGAGGPGGGDDGAGGDASDGADDGAGGPRTASTGGVSDAAMAPNSALRPGACFAPDAGQIANLQGRATYDGSVTASWQNATHVSIVPIELCPDARDRLAAALAADPNIGKLHAAIAADARLSGSLEPSYEPGDVLAVDSAGNRLTVYVF